MFSIGEQLFRPTVRDERTLLLEPRFTTSGTQVLAAAAATGTFDIPIPQDRSYYLHSFNFSLSGAALSTWSRVVLQLQDSSGNAIGNLYEAQDSNATGLVGDNQVTNAVALGLNINRILSLLIPPGTSRIRASVTRSNTTNAVNWAISTTGYLLPPGGIGRA